MTSPYVILSKLQNKTRMWILEMVLKSLSGRMRHTEDFNQKGEKT